MIAFLLSALLFAQTGYGSQSAVCANALGDPAIYHVNSALKTSPNYPAVLKRLISQGHLQEALFLAYESGDIGTAKQLAKEIKSILSNGTPKKITVMHVGMAQYAPTTQSYVIEFEGGFKAMYKPRPEYWFDKSWDPEKKWILIGDRPMTKHPCSYNANPIAEVKTYEIAEAIAFYVVPVTVARDITLPTPTGSTIDSNGSLHAFFDVTVIQEVHRELTGSNSFGITDVYRQGLYNKMLAFDYLILNHDRSDVGFGKHHNFDYAANFLVAYDHGLAFLGRGKYPPVHPQSIPFDSRQRDLLENLKTHLSEDHLRKIMNGEFDESILHNVLSHRHELIDELETKVDVSLDPRVVTTQPLGD